MAIFAVQRRFKAPFNQASKVSRPERPRGPGSGARG
jgi:hypothetical protein